MCLRGVRFVLVASTAPCPCGHLGDPDRDCTCLLESIYAWRERMMGHLAFDILVEAPAVTNVSDLMSAVEAERLVESARLLHDARAAWSEDATCCMTETAREFTLKLRCTSKGSPQRAVVLLYIANQIQIIFIKVSLSV